MHFPPQISKTGYGTAHVRPITCWGKLRNLRSGSSTVGLYCVTITWQQIFKGSLLYLRVVGVCRMCLLNADALAGNAERQWLLIEVRHAGLCYVKKCIAGPLKWNFRACYRYTGHFLCGVERAKRFVNVHVHCIVSNLKRITEITTLPAPGKIFADAHVHQISKSNLTSYQVEL